MIHEYELTEIWNKNLKEFNGTMRLDSIIIRAMMEACIKQKKQDKNSNLVCPHCGEPRAPHYEGEGSCESCAQ